MSTGLETATDVELLRELHSRFESSVFMGVAEVNGKVGEAPPAYRIVPCGNMISVLGLCEYGSHWVRNALDRGVGVPPK